MEEYERIDVSGFGDAEPRFINGGVSTEQALQNLSNAFKSDYVITYSDSIKPQLDFVATYANPSILGHSEHCKPWRPPVRRDMRTGWRFKEAGCPFGHVWVWDTGTWRPKLSPEAVRAIEREVGIGLDDPDWIAEGEKYFG